VTTTPSADSIVHRNRQEQFIRHVEKLLDDDRLRIDTTRGRRPVAGLIRNVTPADRTVELTRLLSEMNKPDRDLRNRLPADLSLDVVLSRPTWFFFRKTVARLNVLCVSPTKSLITGDTPQPLTRAELAEVLRQMPAAAAGVPSTLVVMSTSGFAIEANELAARGADRTVILASPNSAGGWSIIGPPETKGLADLFDPEADAEKRRRIRQAIEESRVDLGGAGLAADRIAAKTQVPQTVVDAELKLYAKENAGLAAKRLDGKLVLFRQGASQEPAGMGAIDMPLIDRMKTLFARKGETEKKIAFLAERRAALSQQRDRGYEEMGDLEGREAEMRRQFKEASGEITKRRITSQLLQLRKDIERRQQLLSVLNQQINVVAVHLHNLELVHQGKSAQLPDSEEMAQDAAAAEDVLAELQASGELAATVGGTVSGGMSAEEQALYEELERGQHPDTAATAPEASEPSTDAPVAESPAPQRTAQPPQKRATPEAG
jgi:hypothetical protein